MAQIIDGGGMMFDALMYGQPHPATQSFLAQQFENASTVLSGAGQAFQAQARDMYERLSGSQATRMLRAVGRSVRSFWQIDEIRVLQDVGQFQHAAPKMQRWVMAEPTVRSLYQKQRLDGYSESYVDIDPQGIGESHYDYRRAMDGIVVVNEHATGAEPEFIADNYMDELLPEDADLTLEEQSDILLAWEHVRAHILRKGEDPTSRFNADLM